MERILVVEDDDQVRAHTSELLRAAGYAVTPAETGAIALDLFERNPPDLVLLNAMAMHGGSGFDTCRAMRASPHGADVSVLLVTAVNSPETYRKALAAGADDLLATPVHRAELMLRVRALLALKHMSRELAHTNELLRAQRDTLLRVQRQKEHLTEIIVHDLKSPLAAIVANASFLTSVRGVEPDAKDAAQGVLRASEAMLRMIYNLLDISRSEDGGLQVQRAELDLAASIRDTCQLMTRRASERRQTIEIRLPNEPLVTWADPDLVRRLVENLLDNALRYTPARGQVSVSACEAGEYLEVRIADQGPGIPPDQRQRVFEKYARLDRPEDRAHDRFGRGLGLTFCKLVAEAHGGSIAVEDHAPQGACFCVSLPARPTSQPET